MSAEAAGARGIGITVALIAGLLLLHLLAGNGYGYFRDELYYLACADHPAWGYVDQPPLSIWLLWLWRALFGDSILALRAFPALMGAASLWLTLDLVRRLGGRSGAALLAGAAFLLAPIYLAMQGYWSMNSIDILLWTLAEWQLLRIVQNETDAPQTRAWLLLGVILGLGLLNKLSVLWLGAGLAAGLLLTPQRCQLRRPGPWLAAGLALLIALPYAWWNWQHDFPMLEFMRNASHDKYVAEPPLKFLGGVVLEMNPATVPIWLVGLVACFLPRARRSWRLFGVIFVVVLAILLANGTSKSEYLSPVFPFFLAAGATTLERWSGRPARWTMPVGAAAVTISGLVIAPITLPLLPVESFIAYSQWLGVSPPNSEGKQLSALPQHYADRFGWPELSAAVAKVYATLSPDEKKHVAIITDNYGEAGAIDFFGCAYGLPAALSQHNNYYLWGYGDWDGQLGIFVRRDAGGLRNECETLEQVGEFSHPYAMPYENHLPIYLCRGFKHDIASAWAGGKHYQ